MRTKKGFAGMSPEQQRAIASKGGKAAHAKGAAHVFTHEEAVSAGQKGGEALLERRGSEHMAQIGRAGGDKISRDSNYMRQIGRKGGETVSGDRAHMAEIGRKSAEARKAKADDPIVRPQVAEIRHEPTAPADATRAG